MFIGGSEKFLYIPGNLKGHVYTLGRAGSQKRSQKALSSLPSLDDPETLHKQEVKVKENCPNTYIQPFGKR